MIDRDVLKYGKEGKFMQMKGKLWKSVLCIALVGMMILPTGCKKETGQDSSYYLDYEYYEEETGAEKESDNTSDKNESTGDKEKTSSTATDKDIKKNQGTNGNSTVETVDVKGYKYTIYSPWLPTDKSGITTEFEKVLFARIEEVEKALGCKITIVRPDSCTKDSLQPLIMAGKKVGDIIEPLSCNVLSLASSNYIVPWNGTGIDVNSPNYIARWTELNTYNGKTYGIQFQKPTDIRTCIIFNKTLLKKCGVDADGIYDLVSNKQWTFEKFREYVTMATKYNGNEAVSYGLGGTPIKLAMGFVAANGGATASLVQNKVVSTMDTDHVKYALNYLNGLIHNDKAYNIAEKISDGTHYLNYDTDGYYQKLFKSGKVAFWIDEGWVLEQQVKGKVNFDYGLVPLPIGPNAGNRYISCANNSRVLCITSTNFRSKDFKKSMTIFNELSKPPKGYTGDDWWQYDVKMNCFQSQSAEKDLAMYLLIHQASTPDIGYGTMALRTDFITKVIYDGLMNGKTTTGAAIDSIKTTHNKTLDSMYNSSNNPVFN